MVKSKKKAGNKSKGASKPANKRNPKVTGGSGRQGGGNFQGGIVLPKKLSIEPKSITIVYGMHVEPEIITRSAIEAYNKRRYTVHDVRLTDFIPDPKFRNLMVKIAVLDRIQEELFRIYPDAVILRPNTVTLMVR